MAHSPIWIDYISCLIGRNPYNRFMQATTWPYRVARSFALQVAIVGSLLLLMWLVEAVDTLLFRSGLDQFGVWPRHLSGLWGILFAPFLHANFAHLAANSIPFAFLGWLVLVRGLGDYVIVTVAVMVSSGLGTWLMGASDSIHIGASGIVFGYFGFLLLRAVYERSLMAMSSALIVIMLYGSFIWGVFPLMMGVSWQMHLFGFVGGAFIARSLANRQTLPIGNDEDLTGDLLIIDYRDVEETNGIVQLPRRRYETFDLDQLNKDDLNPDDWFDLGDREPDR